MPPGKSARRNDLDFKPWDFNCNKKLHKDFHWMKIDAPYPDDVLSWDEYKKCDIVSIELDGGCFECGMIVHAFEGKKGEILCVIAWIYDRQGAEKRSFHAWPEGTKYLLSNHFQLINSESFRGRAVSEVQDALSGDHYNHGINFYSRKLDTFDEGDNCIVKARRSMNLSGRLNSRTNTREKLFESDRTFAGVAFTGGGGSRQLGPDDNDPSESDDFCSACRGAGEFVCCENCPRVFHLLCCDPPRTEVPDGAFYCYECNAKSAAPDGSADSYPSLGPLFNNLERTNPRAFALPSGIQNNFEGVSARPDGSYSEEVKKFPLAKNSGYGYQRPEYTKLIDADHKVILCTQCGVSSGNKRQMLKCDFCYAYWHLDCVDPPLANPPHISLEASQRDAWRCPRHIEHDLRSGLLLQNDLSSKDGDSEMADAAPVARVPRRVRVRKQPEYVESTFSRGMRNNGLIDITNDPDDDTDGEGNYVFGDNVSKNVNSKIFRVSEKGLILDFVSKVKRYVQSHQKFVTLITNALQRPCREEGSTRCGHCVTAQSVDAKFHRVSILTAASSPGSGTVGKQDPRNESG
ncbi:hypothetical protein IG631_23739 [Alternaria alternata]|nr:hypothetical protein IG631_23739 [Alternaria alternata]